LIPDRKIDLLNETPQLLMEHGKEFTSFKDYHDLEFEELCKIKQGYVAEIISEEF